MDFRSSRRNAFKCKFTVDLTLTAIEYNPNDLIGYRYHGGKYYISRNVDFEEGSQWVFLEYLIDGKVDVFYYRDESGDNYLIEDEQGILRRLKNPTSHQIVNGTVYEFESKQYLGMMRAVFEKSPEVVSQLDEVSLSHKSLINIAQEYHYDVCDDQECIIYEKRMPATYQFGLLLGVNRVMLEDAGGLQYYDYLNLQDANRNQNLQVGGYMKFSQPSVSERLFLKYEIAYSFIRWNSYKTVEYSNVSRMRQYFHIRQHAWKNNFLFQYDFPKGFFRPVILVGGFLDYFFLNDNERFYVNEFGDSKDRFVIPVNQVKDVDFGLAVGFGVKHLLSNSKEVILDLRYHRGFNYMDGMITNYLVVQCSYEL